MPFSTLIERVKSLINLMKGCFKNSIAEIALVERLVVAKSTFQRYPRKCTDKYQRVIEDPYQGVKVCFLFVQRFFAV